MSVSGYICNWLFSIGEDGSKPKEWPGFTCYLEDIKTLKEFVFSIQRSFMYHKYRIQKIDSLVRIVRKQSSSVIYMDAKLPIWFAEWIWVCIRRWQKKNTKKPYIQMRNIFILNYIWCGLLSVMNPITF